MLRSQKILIAVVLLLVAWLLHINMCDWTFDTRYSMFRQGDVWTRQFLFGWRQTKPDGEYYTGLITEPYAGHLQPLLLGVIVPLLLIALDAYLILGWRRSARIARGMCARCGYDLRGSADAGGAGPVKCPECGLLVAAEAKHAA